MGTPLELPRQDLMEIAEDFNDSDREVGNGGFCGGGGLFDGDG